MTLHHPEGNKSHTDPHLMKKTGWYRTRYCPGNTPNGRNTRHKNLKKTKN
jgi:hypothetical protein